MSFSRRTGTTWESITNLKGDQIYNGAADNASGTAAVLEIARAFTHSQTAPKRRCFSSS